MSLEPLVKKSMHLHLSADAVDALATLTTERKQGEFVSALILGAHQQKSTIAPHIAEQLRALAAQIEGI